jgi:hypothetical protein
MPRLRNLHKLLDPEIRAKNLRALHWELRGLWWDLTRPPVPDPVFVVGCSRSGTTITYETLAAAPQFLSFGWEIPQFWDGLVGPLNNGWDSEAADAGDARPAHRDAALRHFYQRLGRGWVLDKTCINVMRVPYLHALFPQAKFVFIHRDGRDNVSSMIDGWHMGRTDGRFELSVTLGPCPEPVAIEGGRFKEWAFSSRPAGAPTTAPAWPRSAPSSGSAPTGSRSTPGRRFRRRNGCSCATRTSSSGQSRCSATPSAVWACRSAPGSRPAAPISSPPASSRACRGSKSGASTIRKRSSASCPSSGR